MKKQSIAIMTAIIVLLVVNPVNANAERSSRVNISVNDVRLNPDSPAYISSTNRTMVPVSFISQALKFETTWNSARREATIKANGKTLVIPMGVPYAYIDGVKTEMDPGKGTIALVKDSRTMVPIKFVANTFDVDVTWAPYPVGGGLVKITTKGYVPVKAYPVVPGGHTFVEGKVLTYDQVPGAKEPKYGNTPYAINLTDANSVNVAKNLTIYPDSIVVVKGAAGTAAAGKEFIYMKASGNGGADMYIYKDGQKVNSMMRVAGDGWMMIGDTTAWNVDYLLYYGDDGYMIPMPSKSDTNGKVYNSLDEAKREN